MNHSRISILTALVRVFLLTLLIRASIFGQTTAAAPQKAAFTPFRLRCEYRIDPLGIDSTNPRLDWILQPSSTSARGLSQSAYQILVASSPELLAQDKGDLWDSGTVTSDQMSQIPYHGNALRTNEAYWWKVRVWDQAGNLSTWSPVTEWTMGVLKPEGWEKAEWIGAPDTGAKPDLSGPKPKYETVLLRRDFSIKPGIKRAIVNICGLGQYEMTVNGGKAGNDLLTPGWTQYDKTSLYDTYDITAQLKTGENAVGIFLGNGMYLLHKGRFSSNTNMTSYYGPLQTIASIRLEYADGTIENVVTDDNWRCASGPITYSSGYGGEDYDARLEQREWDMPGFKDSAWDKPELLNGPGGELKGLSCAGLPVRAFQSLIPVHQQELKPGTTIVDLGQNAAIMLRMKVKGASGSIVKVTPAELLNPDGTISRGIFNNQPVYWQYTLNGQGEETYFSRFFYVGARYLQVELTAANGSSDLPRVESIEGVVVHSSSPEVGRFSCSNQLFNSIFMLVHWAQQNNMVSILTDCPTREKRGWLEQDYLNGPALRYNFDLAALYSKIVNDMKDSARPDGLVPSTSPDYTHWNNKFADSPEWSSACILVPWQQYEFSGDRELLGRAYDTMKAYHAYLAGRAKDNIVSFGLGDWYDIGPGRPGDSKLTPLSLTATAYYFEDTRLISEIANLLGKTDDSAHYNQLAGQIRDAFNEALFNPRTNQYGSGDKVGSQCANALPLVVGITGTANRQAVLDNIVRNLRQIGLTAGDVGYRYLLRALADGGRSDVIYAVNN